MFMGRYDQMMKELEKEHLTIESIAPEEANDNVEELKSRIRKLEIKLAECKGIIAGLKFSIRCNGVSGAEINNW